MPWWQRRQALLCGLTERLPTSMSTHLSFLSKSNQPALPQMGRCFSLMNSTAFWFALTTKTQLLYQFWGKHGMAKQVTRYFKLQPPQAVLYSSLVYPHIKKDSIVRIRWFGRCEGFPTMAKCNGLGKKGDKEASWASPFGYQTAETMGPIGTGISPGFSCCKKENAGLLVQAIQGTYFSERDFMCFWQLFRPLARRNWMLDNSEGQDYIFTKTLFMHTLIFFLLSYFMCTNVLHECTSVNHISPGGQKRTLDLLELENIRGWKPPCRSWE